MAAEDTGRATVVLALAFTGETDAARERAASALADPGISADARAALVAATAFADYVDARFADGDALLFGCETAGLPADVFETIPANQRLRLPMCPNSRSLNLSNSVAVAVYEAWRQLGFVGAGNRE